MVLAACTVLLVNSERATLLVIAAMIRLPNGEMSELQNRKISQAACGGVC
jgi:hypothetical protein